MRMPDLTEMAIRALVGMCMAIAALEIAGEILSRVGPYLIPLAVLAAIGWAFWRTRVRL